MTNPFYNSKKWKDKRKYILHRDGYLCQECKKYGRNREAKIVHHIKEIEDNPELKLANNNLVSVCASCHNKIHPEKGGHRITQ
jgi:5-methylcytosine-specific restriction endonuclease McrA